MSSTEIFKEWKRLTLKAVKLAQEAIRCCQRPGIRLAGSLPPLGATFDATYPVLDPNSNQPFVSSTRFYSDLAQIFVDNSVDILLIETCPSIAFAIDAVKACRTIAPRKELWLSFVLQSSQPSLLCSRETVTSAIEALSSILSSSCQLPEAILFNCSTTEAILNAVAAVRPLYQGRLGGYGNRRYVRSRYGLEQSQEQAQANMSINNNDKDAVDLYKNETDENSEHKIKHISGERIDLDPTGYANWTQRWVEAGASIIGGCCQVRPSHIRELAERKKTGILTATTHRPRTDLNLKRYHIDIAPSKL